MPGPPLGSLPSPEIKPRSPVWQADSSPADPPWKPRVTIGSRFNNTRGKRVRCKLLSAILAECLVCSVHFLGHGKFFFTQMGFLLFLFLTSLTILNSGDPKFPFSFFEQNEAKKRVLCVYFKRLPFCYLILYFFLV